MLGAVRFWRKFVLKTTVNLKKNVLSILWKYQICQQTAPVVQNINVVSGSRKLKKQLTQFSDSRYPKRQMFIYNEAWSSRHCSCQEGDNFCLMTGHHHIYTFIKINETWKDGACRRCKCYASKPTKDCPGIKHIHYKYIYSKAL